MVEWFGFFYMVNFQRHLKKRHQPFLISQYPTVFSVLSFLNHPSIRLGFLKNLDLKCHFWPISALLSYSGFSSKLAVVIMWWIFI